MASETIHAHTLSREEVAMLQEAGKDAVRRGDVGRLEELGLLMRKGEEWVITDEGRATLRTVVDPDHPLH